MLVRHPLDSECAATVAGYRDLLKPNDRTFLDYPLDRLIELSGQAIGFGQWEHWLAGFKTRYLDITLSSGYARTSERPGYRAEAV